MKYSNANEFIFYLVYSRLLEMSSIWHEMKVSSVWPRDSLLEVNEMSYLEDLPAIWPRDEWNANKKFIQEIWKICTYLCDHVMITCDFRSKMMPISCTTHTYVSSQGEKLKLQEVLVQADRNGTTWTDNFVTPLLL